VCGLAVLLAHIFIMLRKKKNKKSKKRLSEVLDLSREGMNTSAKRPVDTNNDGIISPAEKTTPHLSSIRGNASDTGDLRKKDKIGKIKTEKIGVFGDIQIILRHPKFRPLRTLLTIWVVFTLVAGGYWAYTLMNAGVSSAATFADNTQAKFNAGTYSDTQWDATNNWVEGTNIIPNPIWELPDSASTSGWQDMSGNIALWHMNETSGPITDSSGNGNNGTATNGVIYNVSGKLNTALSFDGTNDYIDTTGLTSTSKNYTFSFWVNSAVAVGQYKYLTDIQTGRLILAWGGYTSGQLAFYDGAWKDFGTNTFNDGAWHNVIFVLSGTSASLYVDGLQFGSSLTYSPQDLGGSISLGSNYSGTNSFFSGKMDEVAIWNRALTTTEIGNIYKQQSILYSGTFTSAIKDAGGDSTWNSIAWVPNRPVGKELPDNATSEVDYASGNANMAGNVLLMHMNESSSLIADTSGNGNNGTVNGGVIYGATGKLNTALSFDGVSDYVDAGNDTSLDIGNGTWEAWIYPTSFSDHAYHAVISKFYSTAYWFGLYSNGGRIQLWVAGGAHQSTGAVELNKWSHVVATWDGSTIKYYINGQFDSQNTGVTGSPVTNTLSVDIGADPQSTLYRFTGTIDEVAIYNRALSATEIADNYKRGEQKLKYQVRSCNDASCSGESFIGPDGTSSDYYEWGTTNSITTPSFALTNVPNNQYFQYKAFFETAISSYTPEIKSVTADYSIINYVPNTPINSTPASGTSNQPLGNITLTSSAFSDPDAGNTHQASAWAVSSASDFSSILWEAFASSTALTSVIIPASTLSASTTYYWRVQHQDNNNAWSASSTPTTFTTSLLPSTPTNSSPTSGATSQNLTPTLSASSFVSDSGLSHKASQWLIRSVSDASYSSPVYDSGATTTAITSIVIPQGTLSENAIYNWKVSYSDDRDIWSATSTETTFVTGVVPIVVVSIGATEYQSGETAKLVVQVTDAVGDPINDAVTTLDFYDTSNNLVGNNVTMPYISGSDGLYSYSTTTSSTEGVYTYSVKAASSGQTSYSSHTFHVSPALNTIKANLTTNVSNLATQSAVNTVSTNVSSILTDTSTTIPAQINTATSTIVTEINANEAKIDSLITNMDILIGAMIVTQSTVNDASASATSFDTALTNATDDFYKNAVLTFTSGTLNGQSRRISGYVGSTKVINLEPALTSAPANGDGFTIVTQNVRVQEQVASVATTVSDTNTKVTDIQSTVNSISTLLTSVDSKIDTMQSAVSSVRTSQQALYNVELSGARAVQVGSTYRVKLTVEDYETNPISASSTPTIFIYDSARAVALATTTMTEIATGVYEATYSIPSSATSGLYESIVSASVGGSTITRTNYWQATGAPSQVIVNSISDSSVSSISADVTISNEGNASYEYQYEWCVVTSQSNQCGGGDDVDYASAAKLVSPGASFNTTLTLTVPDTGDYWFKVVNYYGTESASASRSFSATTESASTGGSSSSVSGGNGPIVGSNVGTLNQLQLTSNQLIKALKGAETININVAGLASLLNVSEQNTETLKDVQNKLGELRAVSDTINAVVTNNSTSPIVQAFMQFNSVELRFLITNPSSERQILKFKAALPQEATPEDIMNANGLNVEYDPNAQGYFVSAEIELGGGESVVKKVEMRDIWVFESDEIKAQREQAQGYADALEKTQYGAQATLLMGEINRLLTTVGQTQAKSYDTPQNHIVVYRINVSRMAQVATAVQKLKDLVTQTGASLGLLGSIGGIQTFATWGIILAIVFGFGLLAAIVFAMWRQQTMLVTALGRHGRRVPGLKYPDISPVNVQNKKIVDSVATKISNMNIEQDFTSQEDYDPKGFLARLAHIVRVLSGSAIGILILVSFPGFVIGILMFTVPSFINRQESDKIVPLNSIQINEPTNTPVSEGFETFTESSPQSISSTMQQILIKDTPTGWLNVRSSASRSAGVIGKVYPGEQYEFTEKKDGWYLIVFENTKAGWVLGKYVSLSDASSMIDETSQEIDKDTIDIPISEQQTSNKVKILNTPTGYLNVRGKPAISEKLLGEVYSNDEYVFEAEKDGWYYIIIPKGIDGWISGEYAEIIK